MCARPFAERIRRAFNQGRIGGLDDLEVVVVRTALETNFEEKLKKKTPPNIDGVC